MRIGGAIGPVAAMTGYLAVFAPTPGPAGMASIFCEVRRGKLMRTGVHLAAALATMPIWAVIQPPRQAHAQVPSLQGTYDLDGGASQDIGTAIDKVADAMSFLAAPMARKRLMATNPPVRRITISYTDKEVTIQADGGAALRTPADGTPIDWTREGGETVKVVPYGRARN
jgi:hypothetical protein